MKFEKVKFLIIIIVCLLIGTFYLSLFICSGISSEKLGANALYVVWRTSFILFGGLMLSFYTAFRVEDIERRWRIKRKLLKSSDEQVN